MPTYTLDFKLWACVTVEAASPQEAVEQLTGGGRLDCATVNLGSYDDGSPIVCEASIEGDPDVYEE